MGCCISKDFKNLSQAKENNCTIFYLKRDFEKTGSSYNWENGNVCLEHRKKLKEYRTWAVGDVLSRCCHCSQTLPESPGIVAGSHCRIAEQSAWMNSNHPYLSNKLKHQSLGLEGCLSKHGLGNLVPFSGSDRKGLPTFPISILRQRSSHLQLLTQWVIPPQIRRGVGDEHLPSNKSTKKPTNKWSNSSCSTLVILLRICRS